MLAEEKEQVLQVDISRDLEIIADSHFLRQVLMNLIDNAIKYSPPKSQIRILATKDSKNTSIIVKDNGPGIASEHHAKIFDRFYRIDRGRSRAVGGAGLGLAISHWIISMHKGQIKLNSELGLGAEFIIQLQNETKEG